jgi:hypothetical protein
MANLREVSGTYGSGKTPCTVFVYENRNGSRWYAAEGSVNVNKTYDEIEEGVDIEELSDDDAFTWSSPIESLEELEIAVED